MSTEMKWYVVHTYSGQEHIAKKALEEKVRKLGIQDKIGEILIPSEEVIELVDGKRKVTERKFFPGYILVKMIMNEETYSLVKNTPRVTGFVGRALNPTPIPDEEAERLTSKLKEELSKPKPKEMLSRGDMVRVIDGPFASFSGVVEEIKPDKCKVRVLVSIFGRPTPVELDFMQVEKT